ncbi:hypothetical protein GF339_17885, partial [candidate division KSB3 bacterium]|nr:hypothetical protein [candidate division KSB3 bacterium]MBD3326459.1 hypothetical protein [candidate division KSB3 bacterium]
MDMNKNMWRIAGCCVVGSLLLISYGLNGVSPYLNQADAQSTRELEMPFLEEWASSGHADHTAEAFSHWDQNVPQRIPEECAKCHSTPGYLDFLGVDGSPARHVDAPAPVGTTVECIACHNEVAMTMDSVVMPSGLEITGLGEEARCMQCHQGQASKFTVDAAIDKVNLPDPDTVSPDLEFVNIHYYAAVATKYGTMAKSGYEYYGKTYDTHFSHITDLDPCI